MRTSALRALLMIAHLAVAQSSTPSWKNGPQEKMCGQGTYHDALDLSFRNATAGFGETLVSVQVLPSFDREYALIIKRLGTDLKLYRVAFQVQLWTQLGPLRVRRTRQECLELASSATTDTRLIDSAAEKLRQLWASFGNIELKADDCPRRGKKCAYLLDGTDYVVQTQDGRSFRITETGNLRGVRSENPALLAWIHSLQQQFAPDSQAR